LGSFENNEDAGVYLLDEKTALIQTLDFFTPIVDDPFAFGQIAAANSLSDVYAMGGKPLTVMNIVCFPIGKMDGVVLREALRGGMEKIREAGALLVGGHSVQDDEFKYGLSVTGVVAPERLFFNKGAKLGDKLVLTKPLGMGIVATALKGEAAPLEVAEEAIAQMAALNKQASELAQAIGTVNACTDITGFGLIGHALEMLTGNNEVGFLIHSSKIPLLAGVEELAEMGFLPGGLYRNKSFRMPFVDSEIPIDSFLFEVLFDPQTSGGLLLSLPASSAELLVDSLLEAGVSYAAVVGEVVASPQGKIRVV